MSRFSGPQPGYKDPSTRAKGVERRYKEQKKLEAEVRDELLAPDDPKRRAVRLATLPEPDTTTRKRQRTRKSAVQKVCIGCNSAKGEPHEDYCPVVTGTLSTILTIIHNPEHVFSGGHPVTECASECEPAVVKNLTNDVT